jgi:hypothetical protein
MRASHAPLARATGRKRACDGQIALPRELLAAAWARAQARIHRFAHQAAARTSTLALDMERALLPQRNLATPSAPASAGAERCMMARRTVIGSPMSRAACSSDPERVVVGRAASRAAAGQGTGAARRAAGAQM